MKKNYFLPGTFQKWKENVVQSMLIAGATLLFTGTVNAQIQMIYTSDSHYGITRANFQGATNVDAHIVNAAMVAKLNGMSNLSFPNDNGFNAGQVVGPIDYVINTGDLANRQESAAPAIQSAAASWAQFSTDYLSGLTLKNKFNQNTPVLLAPGNHDVSDAIGFYRAMNPLKDNTSMFNIYNYVFNPTTPKNASTYNYTTDKINYSKNIGGVHFMFVTLWPDSTNRIWMNNDIATVSAKTPVVIFTHDQPDIETKHLHNPNGIHDINGTDKFENMVEETCKDGLTVSASSAIEQRGFASWVKAHSNVKAYFHGNSNANEYYVFKGPDNNIALRTIRVDSPMKGNISATDETKLSYQVVSLDSVSKNMTVRECLWNPTAINGAQVQWGATITFALSKVDSLLSVANSLTDINFTTPSWTLLKRAVTSATSLKDSTSTVALQNALNGLKGKDFPYSIVSSINGNPTSRLGFAWFTNVGVNGGKVEIIQGSATDYNAFATPLLSINAKCDSVKNLNYNVSANGLLTLAGIADNTKKSYMKNKALATGLTPNTTYSYRVGKTGAWSEIGTFTTAKTTKDKFSFVYITDTQAQTDAMFNTTQTTTHAASAMYPGANFWLGCGDLIESSGSANSEWEYEQFFQTQQDIFLKKPFASVIGNHDFTTNKNFTHHFNTDSIGFDYAKSTVPGSIYSFVYGDALFMALDYEDYGVAGQLDSIGNWMRRQVAANPATKWRIAFYHKTMYTGSSSHQSDTDGKTVRDKLAPVFDELNIDLALQGHDHVYEVMGPIKNKTLVANAVSNLITVTFDAVNNVSAKNGGIFNVKNGTLYFLNNSAGLKKYLPRSQSQMAGVESGLGLTNYFGMFTGRFGQGNNPTFSNITVSTDTIEIKTFEVSPTGVSSLYDSFRVVKSNATTAVDNIFANGQNAVSVYPVPVKNFATINFKEAVDAKVEVYSLNGSMVKSQLIHGSAQINLQQLPKGVYTLKVVSGTSNYAVKFVKE